MGFTVTLMVHVFGFHMHGLKLSVTAISYTLASISFAGQQSASFFTEEDMMGELPIIASASRMNQPVRRVPASISIIDRDMIDASGAMTWVDVFRLAPGFQAYSINGNRYGIGYHGFGDQFPNHMEVMVDGRSIYEPAFAGIEWASLGITLDEVDYIEIIRGSSAPAHGSNAFVGAINIITQKPQQESGMHQRFTIGARQTREGHIRYSGHQNKLDYRISVNYQDNEGFPSVSSGEDAGPLEDGKESLGLNLRAMYTPNATHIFDFQVGYNHNNLGWGDVDHPDDYSRVEMESQYQSLKWTHNLNATDTLKVHAYHNKLEGENFVNQGLLSDLISEEVGFTVNSEDVRSFLQSNVDSSLNIEDQHFITGSKHTVSERYDVELEHHLQLTNQLRTTWGAGIRYDRVKSEVIFGHKDDETLTSRRLFGHAEWQPFHHWTFNTGFMLEHNSLVNTIGSGRIGANYHINDHHTIRVAYAQGKRSPTLTEAKEFNVDIIADQLLISAIRRSEPNLDEERIKTIELGYLATFPHYGLTADIRLFREEVRDAFDVYQQTADIGLPMFDPDERFSVRGNIAEGEMKGVELQVRYQPNHKTLVTGHYGYRNMDGEHISSYGTPSTTDSLNEHGPRHTAGLLVNQKFTRAFDASINAYHITDADWKSGNEIDQFVRVDAQLRFNFSIASTKGSIAFIGQNLGKDYMEHGENNVFESRYYLKLTLDLP